MNEHAEALLGSSDVTGRPQPNRSILQNFRVTPAERDAIRAAAEWENMTVAAFIRAALAVRARDGYCKRLDAAEGP